MFFVPILLLLIYFSGSAVSPKKQERRLDYLFWWQRFKIYYV